MNFTHLHRWVEPAASEVDIASFLSQCPHAQAEQRFTSWVSTVSLSGRRSGPGPSRANRVEIPVHRQGLMARSGGQPRCHRRHLQPHHGSVREVRHDLQRDSPSRVQTSSPGRYAGQDNGWVGALIGPVMLEFDQSVIKYPSIKRYPGGGSTDLIPDLQHPENPAPLVKDLGRTLPIPGND